MNEVKDEKAREAIDQTVNALDEFNYDTCELVIKKKVSKILRPILLRLL